MQWPKEKNQIPNNNLQKTTHKTKDKATQWDRQYNAHRKKEQNTKQQSIKHYT